MQPYLFPCPDSLLFLDGSADFLVLPAEPLSAAPPPSNSEPLSAAPPPSNSEPLNPSALMARILSDFGFSDVEELAFSSLVELLGDFCLERWRALGKTK